MNNRWDKDEIFREECRRRMGMPLEQRLLEGFINRSETYVQEPVCRVFATMAEYRRWCNENRPPHRRFPVIERSPARERTDRGEGDFGDDRQKPL